MKVKFLSLIAFSLTLFMTAHAKPNILFIFIDDMGFADPSSFGNPLMRTPHIDQLAEEGIKLTNFYVNSPICSASRVALTTGQYQGRWKIHSFLNSRAGNANRGMANYLDPSAPTTAKKLKAAGYATAHFGKWHMGGGRDVDDAPLPQAYGFDESLVSFEGLGDRLISNPNGIERAKELGHGEIIPCTRWERIQIQADRTIDFIKRHKDQPFYVRLFPNDVHDKHEPFPGTADKYAPVSDHPPERDFLAVLEELDRQIGRVVGEIDKLGLAEETLIIFTSDNGPTDWPKKYLDGGYPAGFTGPYHGRKWSLYEGGVRMPFIARWKGTIPAGAEDTTSVVSAIDMSPTMCQFVGVPVEADLDGIDRSDVLLGKPSIRSNPVFWQYGHPHALLKGGKPEYQSPTFSVRDGRWKFLVNPDGSEAQLYDLEADEGETRNLLVEQSNRAADLSAQLAAWADEIGFGYDDKAALTAPGPTVAVLAGNQLLRFKNQG
ncbi:MAG: sulfatase-like hydrolase/transferase, partial [Opitutales bacterium]|nr:sulfatase-like hydrolase/transferase [Opitutales bacterium]